MRNLTHTISTHQSNLGGAQNTELPVCVCVHTYVTMTFNNSHHNYSMPKDNGTLTIATMLVTACTSNLLAKQCNIIII